MTALLLLDVDGVLNPYAASRRWLDSSDYRKRNIHGFPVWLDKAHGPLLLDLAETADLELAWCTTWEHLANIEIGPRIGLPELPVITFPRKFSGAMTDRWKFGPVLKYAGDRPLAWLDDDFELEHEDCGWFREQRGDHPTLLQLVDPHHGLRQRDVDAIAAWAAESQDSTSTQEVTP